MSQVPPVTGQEALRRLQDGNAKYRWGLAARPRCDVQRMRETAAGGQQPFAAVLACADSRVPVELLFDQGIGDLFVVRVAGNVCGPDQIASLEYAAEHLGAPLVVVLGHTQCGAVTAAASGPAAGGHLGSLLEKIRPAVDRAKEGCPHLGGPQFVTAAVEANVWLAASELMRESAAVAEGVAAGRISVVGAVYDLVTGEVRWLDPPLP